MALADLATEAKAAAGRAGRSAIGRLRHAWALSDPVQATVFTCALALLLASTLFGGASQTNALSLMTVELVSLPLLFVSAYLIVTRGMRGVAAPLAILAATLAIPLMQLIPLPADIWTRLPGRGAVVHILEAARLGRPALPYSLTPEESWRAVLALIPPTAMFLGALLLGERQRRVIAAFWLPMAVVSLAIGALQILEGPTSPLYFYRITNLGSSVGLFANRNHQAAFLFCLLPVAAAFAAEFRGDLRDRRAFSALLAVLYVFMAIIGVAATRSRAGIALTGLALLGALAVALRSGALRRRWTAALQVGLGGLVAIAAVALFALGPILSRFGELSNRELRFESWPIVLKVARDFLPFGSGIGSFDTVYRTVEPLSQVSPTYFNHAHNDYLELWLETGLAGAVVFLLFAAWFVRRSATIWLGRGGSGRGGIAAAATVVVGLLLAHSVVDYPLRTEALAVLFAFACGTIAADRRPAEGTAPSDA